MLRIIFGISSVLMLTLAFLNAGSANDDHFTVIEIIRQTGKLPQSTQCWQCYHPKLYHFSIAKIWDIFQIDSPFWKFRSAQLFNAIFGILTLYIVFIYTKTLSFSKNTKAIVFALIALNPRFITIFAEATNDALIIFFGNVALFSLIKLFKTPSKKYSILLILAVVLGSMTKMNVGVYFIGSLLALIVLAILHKNYLFSISKGYLGTALGVFLFSSIAFFSFNGYLDNVLNKEKPFKYNTPVEDRLPPLYKKPDAYFPGIQTIYSGYFKFHYLEMIKYPRIVPGINNDHLTSLFSQLYGRTHFFYFDHWPVEWRIDNPIILKIGSTTLAMGIVPTLIAIFGSILMLFYVLRALKNRDWNYLKRNDYWLILLFLFGYLGFAVAFSMFGRIYTFMKIIYLMPGIIAVVVPVCIGISTILNRFNSKYLNYAFYSHMIALIILYQIPFFHLLIRLTREQFILL